MKQREVRETKKKKKKEKIKKEDQKSKIKKEDQKKEDQKTQPSWPSASKGKYKQNYYYVRGSE